MNRDDMDPNLHENVTSVELTLAQWAAVRAAIDAILQCMGRSNNLRFDFAKSELETASRMILATIEYDLEDKP